MSDPNRPEQNLSDNEADEVPDEDDFLRKMAHRLPTRHIELVKIRSIA